MFFALESSAEELNQLELILEVALRFAAEELKLDRENVLQPVKRDFATRRRGS